VGNTVDHLLAKRKCKTGSTLTSRSSDGRRLVACDENISIRSRFRGQCSGDVIYIARADDFNIDIEWLVDPPDVFRYVFGDGLDIILGDKIVTVVVDTKVGDPIGAVDVLIDI